MSPVAGLPPFAVQMVLTESAGFALYADGKVWSWGLPAYGQLGRPGTGSHQAPAVVAGLPPITALASGNSHLLALDRSGRVWTWGANAAGQLGNGTLGRERTAGACSHAGAHGQSGGGRHAQPDG
jgi:alpha-tubulin suppressor-like RCC1 family protein